MFSSCISGGGRERGSGGGRERERGGRRGEGRKRGLFLAAVLLLKYAITRRENERERERDERDDKGKMVV